MIVPISCTKVQPNLLRNACNLSAQYNTYCAETTVGMDKPSLNDNFMTMLLPIQRSLDRYAMFLTRNREDAREVAAQAVAAAYERFAKLHHPSALQSYLFTVATRVWRSMQRHNRRMVSTDDSFGELFSTSASAEEALEVQDLYHAIAKLPQKQQEAIVLFEIMGFSIQEVATTQKSTEVAVKVRLHRARKQLAVLLNVSNESEW
jgi:RNA polymerase sigma-70 factor, ECF subfamily